MRLSVLETVAEKKTWRELKQFIQRYGHDLFTQRFMMLGNLRAILHQGVDAYLQSLLDEPDAEEQFRLVAELDGPLPREDAVRHLTVALEAVAENYAEYVDYNSTTTQSDRGEMLFTLLDYLRLRTSYDLVAWKLQPVVLAHEVLVRGGCDAAAESWREAVAERTAEIAAEHLERFARLNRKYGMLLPSIAERLEERFLRPLEVDQLCALVQPAMEELRLAAGAGSGGQAGGRRRRRPPSLRPPSAACRRGSPSLPAKSRGPVSTCPPGWRPCSRRSIGPSRRPPRTRISPAPNCPSPRSACRGKRCGGRSG